MDVSGTGITQFQAKVLPGFRPRTRLAIIWRQTESGNWAGIDRGSAEDIYEARFGLHGTETVINNFLSEIDDNRDAGSHQITLSDFFDTDHIFGENVDHSGSITATVVEFPTRRQASLNGWAIDLTVRATPATFTGSSSLPTLQYCATGINAIQDWNLRKSFSYEGSASYLDRQADSGIFEGAFTLTQANAILLRNYIRTQRTGDFSLSDTFGIDYPFGPRSANSYPFTVKLIEWDDLGLIGVNWHQFRLRFAEVNS